MMNLWEGQKRARWRVCSLHPTDNALIYLQISSHIFTSVLVFAHHLYTGSLQITDFPVKNNFFIPGTMSYSELYQMLSPLPKFYLLRCL